MTRGRESNQPFEARHDVTATVKWFNTVKGFGFVQPADGSADAFLHVSVVERSGIGHIAEGATIICDITPGQKGPQVAAISRVESWPDETQRAPDAYGQRGGGGQVDGVVKFYNAAKGYGFVTPDDGSQDVFVSATIVQRAGYPTLEPNQRVRLQTRMGQKGPMAASITLL